MQQAVAGPSTSDTELRDWKSDWRDEVRECIHHGRAPVLHHLRQSCSYQPLCLLLASNAALSRPIPLTCVCCSMQLPAAAVQEGVQARAESSSHTAGFSDWHKVRTRRLCCSGALPDSNGSMHAIQCRHSHIAQCCNVALKACMSSQHWMPCRVPAWRSAYTSQHSTCTDFSCNASAGCGSLMQASPQTPARGAVSESASSEVRAPRAQPPCQQALAPSELHTPTKCCASGQEAAILSCRACSLVPRTHVRQAMSCCSNARALAVRSACRSRRGPAVPPLPQEGFLAMACTAAAS